MMDIKALLCFSNIIIQREFAPVCFCFGRYKKIVETETENRNSRTVEKNMNMPFILLMTKTKHI